jgi:hypothetical protein
MVHTPPGIQHQKPIPINCRQDGSRVPKRMGIEGVGERGEVKQLEAHGHNQPGDDQAGPGSPEAFDADVGAHGVAGPEDVCHGADGHVGRHVVGVVPAHELEVVHVGEVSGEAEQPPELERSPPVRPVKPEDPDRAVVQPVHHVRAGAEVVHALGEGEVAGVEERGAEPTDYADVGEGGVVRGEGVVLGEVTAKGVEAHIVRVEVEDGEEDGEGLLDAKETAEGPFAVELLDGEVLGDPGGGKAALARVVAFGAAVPEEQLEVYGDRSLRVQAIFGDAVLGRSRKGNWLVFCVCTVPRSFGEVMKSRLPGHKL